MTNKYRERKLVSGGEVRHKQLSYWHYNNGNIFIVLVEWAVSKAGTRQELQDSIKCSYVTRAARVGLDESLDAWKVNQAT